MRATLRVLADDERTEVHERTLGILARTGLRVDTSLGRRLLADAGARVDEPSRMVRFPADLVERCLALAPRRFELGGRRPGFAAAMNAGDCTLLADGGATQVCEGPGGARRQPTRRDWLDSTRLLDVIDEVGLYWQMVEYPRDPDGAAGWVEHWAELFRLFGKHVQDSLPDASAAVWLREVLDVVFGGAEAVRQRRPFSFLITPTSPLVIEGDHTDAWLALRDTGMPVAVMPMPLMGATSPASQAATIVQANCETLAAAVPRAGRGAGHAGDLRAGTGGRRPAHLRLRGRRRRGLRDGGGRHRDGALLRPAGGGVGLQRPRLTSRACRRPTRRPRRCS